MIHSDRFNIKRCLWLIEHNLTYNKKVIYYIMALYSILGIMATFISTEDATDPVNFIIICMIITFSWSWTYSEERHKLQQIMLPASSVEKFASQMIQATLLTVIGLITAILLESMMYLSGIHDSEPVLPGAIKIIIEGSAVIHEITIALLPAVLTTLALFFAARASNSPALTLFSSVIGLLFIRLFIEVVPHCTMKISATSVDNQREIILSSIAMLITGALFLWMAHRDFKKTVYPD